VDGFLERLNEMANTDAADVNEIMLGYYLANGWSKFVDNADAKKQLTAKQKKIGEAASIAQEEKAKAMADEVLKWAKQNGYQGTIKNVWWTARPGVLAKAVGQEVDSRKNPTDTLVQFSDDKFLGLSAKSTKTQGDIGFKNPGVGTIQKDLNLNLTGIYDRAEKEFLKKFSNLSLSKKARKGEIRADQKIKEVAEATGTKVLNSIREALYEKLSSMSQPALRKYIIKAWMDADKVYPPYIKITGMRVGAKVEDPLKNSKLSALTRGKISLQKVGNDSVGIIAGTKRIMKMRAKFESQKMASPIKFTGDPWK